MRLNGVGAPELKTRAGRDAKRWIVNYLRGRSITCDLNGERTYDRWVGVCFADGQRTLARRSLLRAMRWTARGILEGDIVALKRPPPSRGSSGRATEVDPKQRDIPHNLRNFPITHCSIGSQVSDLGGANSPQILIHVEPPTALWAGFRPSEPVLLTHYI